MQAHLMKLYRQRRCVSLLCQGQAGPFRLQPGRQQRLLFFQRPLHPFQLKTFLGRKGDGSFFKDRLDPCAGEGAVLHPDAFARCV